jgi:hypothetical protein
MSTLKRKMDFDRLVELACERIVAASELRGISADLSQLRKGIRKELRGNWYPQEWREENKE